MAAAPERDVDLGQADHVLKAFEARGRITRENLIPLLQALQAAYGYLPGPVLHHVSRETGIPASHVHGVVTFYAQFFTEPHGRHTVTLCRGTSCHVRGGKKVLAAVRSLLGIEDGETTADMGFSLETVACLGACALAPVMVVDGKYHGNLTPRRAERILRQLVEEDRRKEP